MIPNSTINPHFSLEFRECAGWTLAIYTQRSKTHAEENSENQDAVLVGGQAEDMFWVLIADGVGGSAKGAEAASIAVNTVDRYLTDNGPYVNAQECNLALAEAFNAARSDLRTLNKNYRASIATEAPPYQTTLQALLIDKHSIAGSRIGDGFTMLTDRRNFELLNTTDTQSASGPMVDLVHPDYQQFRVNKIQPLATTCAFIIASDGGEAYFLQANNDRTRNIHNAAALIQIAKAIHELNAPIYTALSRPFEKLIPRVTEGVHDDDTTIVIGVKNP